MKDIQIGIGWNSIDFDWNRARTFLIVAEAGSLSAAAKLTGQNQPTLSRQLAALESELKITLFERVGRGIQLTESGEHLLQYVRSMAEAAGQFSLRASGQSESLAGKVIITASEVDAAYRLPPVIQRIRKLAPEIQLEISVTNQIANLQQREADIAIRNKRPQQPELIARKLTEESVGLFGHANYIEHLQKTNFTDVEIIGFEDIPAMIQVLKIFGWPLSKENFPVVTQFQWLQIQLATQGNGLTLLPVDIGNQIGLIQVLPNLGAIMELPLWLVSHRELRTNPRIKFVYDHIAEFIQA
ncbi:LysR family transcriptional regulator [Reinekea sp.]|jgi:DNA-binding transcriptional LysR family regulator|uniref:LysR family transcriptional regulator n=1 Tax=Reinekea sp. TaxID=1970455 RepID=UPI00398A2CB6